MPTQYSFNAWYTQTSMTVFGVLCVKKSDFRGKSHEYFFIMLQRNVVKAYRNPMHALESIPIYKISYQSRRTARYLCYLASSLMAIIPLICMGLLLYFRWAAKDMDYIYLETIGGQVHLELQMRSGDFMLIFYPVLKSWTLPYLTSWGNKCHSCL